MSKIETRQETDIPDITSYAVIVERLENCRDRVIRMQNTIENIDRRLNGNYPQPCAPETEKSVNEPNGYIDKLNYMSQTLMDVIDVAEAAADALDNRVGC